MEFELNFWTEGDCDEWLRPEHLPELNRLTDRAVSDADLTSYDFKKTSKVDHIALDVLNKFLEDRGIV